jgi:tetratricopeptide (TPR) repeat protein
MRTLCAIALCSISLISFARAQKHPAQAEENPLSTVTYLLSTTDKDDKEGEKACLAKSLGRTDRFNDIPRAIDMVVTDSFVDQDLTVVVWELIARGKPKEASTLVSLLLQRFGDSDYKLKNLIKPMIVLQRDAELDSLIEKFEPTEKIDLLFKSADVYRELGNTDKALDQLERTVGLAKASKYAADRAELALRYAQVGRQIEATELIETILRELDPKVRNINVVHDLMSAYRALGKFPEANELSRRFENGLNIDETSDLVSTASRLITDGARPNALDTLARALTQLDPKEYADSFNLGDIIEIYLKIGEVKKAEQVAMSITGNRHIQQGQLLAIADRYIKAGNKTKARDILRFALQQTYKIDTSEPESGNLWTSGKWEQAQYQSQIVIHLMDLGRDTEALSLTRRIMKPYLRALVLTEYVAVNKKRISARKLGPYLEEALQLLRLPKVDVFDSKRFDVYSIAARNFAEIGMPTRANEIFAETLTELDKYVIEDGSDSALLFAMCNIGVEFERSKIKSDAKVKTALRKIIRNWENDEY